MKYSQIPQITLGLVAGLLAVIQTITPVSAVPSPYGKFAIHDSITSFSNEGDLVFSGDFTGDGYTDLAVASSVNGDDSYRRLILKNNGNNGIASTTVWANSYGKIGDYFYVADFNGDNKDDVLVSTTRLNADGVDGNNDLAWNWLKSTGSIFANGGRIANSYGLEQDSYYVADFNGDNKDDVLVSTTRLNADGVDGNNDLAWNYLRSNGTTFDNGGRIASSYGLYEDNYFVSDFNGDRKDDILVSSTRLNADNNSSSADLAWNYLRSNGSTFDNGGRIATSYGLDEDLYLIGDFTGDGKDDLAVADSRNDSNGYLTWSVVASNGSALLPLGIWHEHSFAKRPNTLFFTGNFGGDSRTDIAKAAFTDESGNPTVMRYLGFGIASNP